MPESTGSTQLKWRIALLSLACGLVFGFLGGDGVESRGSQRPNGLVVKMETSFDPGLGLIGFVMGLGIGGFIVILGKLPRYGKVIAVAFLALVGGVLGATIGAHLGMETTSVVTGNSFSGEQKASMPAVVAGASIGITATAIVAWGTLHSARRRLEGG